ncbi:MAG: FecR domain-containing protein [Bacteroidales bacterium]|nr:FecR domain-containing protein [Bacteroidales bacterium]
MKKYNQYSVEDFVLDDGFRMWVLNEDPQNDAFWREWITRHPGMRPVIDEASRIIRELHTNEASVSKKEIDAGYREVEAFFDKAMERQSRWIGKGFWRIAASILALVVAGLGILFQNQPQDEVNQYITQEGEHEKIELPDGSRVYMKENSRLSYATNWNEMETRKVQLRGEAYFQVEEQLYQGNKVKFVVQANGLSVEVVGTEFVVNNRSSSRTHVALNSGKIRLKLKQTNQVLNMNPGDVVEYDASTNKLLSRRKDVGPSDTWLKGFEESGQSGSTSQSGSDGSIGVTRGEKVNQSPRDKQTSQQNQVQALQPDPSTDAWQTANRSNSNAGSNQTAPNNLQVYTGASTPKQGGSMGSGEQHYILQPEEPDNAQSNNNVGIVRQDGEQNTAYIEQIGEDLASKQDQSGSQNQATANVSGQKDESDDLGWSSWQKQQGSGNVSIFDIVESYNSNMYSTQEGTYNTIDALSQGEDNTSIILQEGKENDVMIRQYGAGNEVRGMDPLAPGVMQEGSFNEVDIIQQGMGNQTRNIQRGQNNQIKVNQDGN